MGELESLPTHLFVIYVLMRRRIVGKQCTPHGRRSCETQEVQPSKRYLSVIYKAAFVDIEVTQKFFRGGKVVGLQVDWR